MPAGGKQRSLQSHHRLLHRQPRWLGVPDEKQVAVAADERIGDFDFERRFGLHAGDRPFDKPCQLAMANAGPDTNGSQFFVTEGHGDKVPQLYPRSCASPSGLCGYTHFGEGVCGCELVPRIAAAGSSQTRLVKVTISRDAPSCK